MTKATLSGVHDMSFFEKDGVVYKHIPAGGHGGGVTGSAVVKASDAEAKAFLAAGEPVEAEAEVEGEAETKIAAVEDEDGE
jgi:hypothetical protein